MWYYLKGKAFKQKNGVSIIQADVDNEVSKVAINVVKKRRSLDKRKQMHKDSIIHIRQ